jgi:TonB family protein
VRNYGSMGQTGLTSINSYYSELKGKRIILITFLLSIIIHLGAITAFQGVSLVRGFSIKPRIYKVDLIRPPIKEIMKSSKEDYPAISQIHSEPPVKKKEATISLDTKDSTYHPYTKVIKERIRNHWVYPLSARQNFIQGNLLIIFRLDRGGNLIDYNIASSSGHEILDTHALKAIRAATPFPPFPENITVQFLNIHASFAYQLRFEQ